MKFNTIKHGYPTIQQKDKIDNQLILTVLGKWFVENSAQNLNNSETTEKELLRTKGLSSSTSDTDVTPEQIKKQKDYIRIDENVLQPYFELIKKQKLTIKESDLTLIKNKLHPFILTLKFHYNRPRPSVLGQYYDISIYPQSSNSLQSPSYPSGHSLISLIVSAYITNKYPKLNEQIIQINKLILESREGLGLSYFSDIASSIQIYKTIENTIGVSDFLHYLK